MTSMHTYQASSAVTKILYMVEMRLPNVACPKKLPLNFITRFFSPDLSPYFMTEKHGDSTFYKINPHIIEVE